MNIGEMIDALRRVAAALPDGLDSEVRVHICNGQDEPAISTRSLSVQPEQELDEHTLEVLSANAVVDVHPHDDPERRTLRPLTMDMDDELARLVEEEKDGGRQVRSDPDGLVVGGMRLPFTEGGVPMVPGSPASVEAGCLCDPEKNNHGLGAGQNAGNVIFVFNRSCPVHRPDSGGPG